MAPDGVTIVSEFGASGSNYPPQKAGVSYGFFGNPLGLGFILTPTPGAANGPGVLGFVADTKFSVNRGFYDTPFTMAITTATPGATIRYTTDGSWPSETNGTIYTGPINVDRTMPVKAIAYKSGFISTNVDTHTYVFVDNVVTQTSATTQSVWGLPASWNGNTVYYGMNGNPSVVNPATHPTIRQDLKSVPSISIVLDTRDMFGSSGIYANPNSSGAAWERKTSLELIDPAAPDGTNDFQQNCAIRIQGGAFRGFGLTRKKSFRVLFKSNYGTSNLPTEGAGKLKYPMFGDKAAQEFNTLTFRMESNDGWQWDAAGGQPQYARDQFGREVALALGLPASHGRFLHVYINGVYWGLYNVVERPDGSFAESYIEGADRDLWEGQNSGSPVNDSVNLSFWNAMNAQVNQISAAASDAARDAAYLKTCGFNPDGSRNPAFPVWVDPNNIADYLLVNWYGGNNDWPFKNYYGGIDTQPTRTGYKYFMWDSEWSLLLQSSVTTNKTSDFSGIAAPQDDLEESPEYALRFADRAHRAMFNEGPLTPANARAIYERITTQHTSILVPESARWGNQHGQQRGVSDWQNEYNRILNTWFPVRTANFLSQLRSRGLYPFLDAPTYVPHGGSLPAGSGPRFSAPSTVAQIYYMFGPGDADPDDYEHSLDPRVVGGGINPAATLVTMGDGGGVPTTQFVRTGDAWKYLDDGSNQGTAWRGAGFNDSAWASGPSHLGYGDNDETTVVAFVDTDPVTAGVQKNATTYFRRVVNIPDPSIFGDFTLNYTYDDGVAIYVNGVEVSGTRQNLAANPAFDQFANGSDGDNAERSATLTTSVFSASNNVIAVEVHQDSATSSDISFDLRLTGNPPGGAGTNVSDPIPLPSNGWLFSRSYNSTTGEWSALNTAYYSVGSVPADADNLVISEFNYHPAEPALPDEISVSTDRDDYEFVELMNVSPQPIDLTGVAFTLGINYVFPTNTILSAGGRVVLAQRADAFTARYGFAPFGVYSGRLDNSGERLVLASDTTGDIQNFIYDNQLPWPVAAEGDGPSLVLINPSQPVPNHGVAANWAASVDSQGKPGAAAAIGFSGNPDANLDGDAFNAFTEFALGRRARIRSWISRHRQRVGRGICAIHRRDGNLRLSHAERAEKSPRSQPRHV
ncbi:MAG: CotH kinase family protein [Chthoniobacteraceae bacterium]